MSLLDYKRYFYKSPFTVKTKTALFCFSKGDIFDNFYSPPVLICGEPTAIGKFPQCSAVPRLSGILTGELSLSCARPTADG